MNRPHPAVQAIYTRQATELDALIIAALKCKWIAGRDDLFGTSEGHALVNAMFELTGVDGLYDLAADVQHEIEARAAMRHPVLDAA